MVVAAILVTSRHICVILTLNSEKFCSPAWLHCTEMCTVILYWYEVHTKWSCSPTQTSPITMSTAYTTLDYQLAPSNTLDLASSYDYNNIILLPQSLL